MSTSILRDSGVANEVLHTIELELHKLHGVGLLQYCLELGCLASSSQLWGEVRLWSHPKQALSQEAAPRDALRKKYGSPGKKTGIAPECEKDILMFGIYLGEI